MMMPVRAVVVRPILVVGCIAVVVRMIGIIIRRRVARDDIKGAMLVCGRDWQVVLNLVTGFGRHRCGIKHRQRDTKRRHQSFQCRRNWEEHVAALSNASLEWQGHSLNADPGKPRPGADGARVKSAPTAQNARHGPKFCSFGSLSCNGY